MATARDMIDSALRLTGVKAPGETATNGEAADALEVWNDLLDALALENLMLYGNENETFNLVANQQSYTIGPSGNFNTKRPVEINQAYVRYNGLDFPLRQLTVDQWNEISLKSYASPIPIAFYYVSSAPLGNVYLWPSPSQAIPLTIAADMQFAALTLDSVINYPPGYKKFFRYALAVELAQEYGAELNPVVITTAASLKASIKAANADPRFSKLDPALTSGPRRGTGLAQFIGGNW